jgi:hypothetical protein
LKKYKDPWRFGLDFSLSWFFRYEWGESMPNLYRGIVLSALFTLLTVICVPAHASKACKGLSQAACSKKSDCSWVKSYKTKTGSQVSAYCRTKSGKKSSAKAKTNKEVKSKSSKVSTKKDKKEKKKEQSPKSQ